MLLLLNIPNLNVKTSFNTLTLPYDRSIPRSKPKVIDQEIPEFRSLKCSAEERQSFQEALASSSILALCAQLYTE